MQKHPKNIDYTILLGIFACFIIWSLLSQIKLTEWWQAPEYDQTVLEIISLWPVASLHISPWRQKRMWHTSCLISLLMMEMLVYDDDNNDHGLKVKYLLRILSVISSGRLHLHQQVPSHHHLEFLTSEWCWFLHFFQNWNINQVIVTFHRHLEFVMLMWFWSNINPKKCSSIFKHHS